MDAQLKLFPELDFDIIPEDITGGPQPQLIALTGRAGSGKSLLSGALVLEGWMRIKFADPLKNMLRAYYRTTFLDSDEIERRIEGDLKEKPCGFLAGQSPRHAMQTLGTEWGRECIGQDFWINAWKDAVQYAMLAEGHSVVVDDTRFANEVGLVRYLGGRVLHVERPSNQIERYEHVSEAFNFDTDATIVNDGTPKEFIEAGFKEIFGS